MSLKISDMMKLPCLQQASVVGGKNGLEKTVSTVSVLEYTNADDLQESLFNSIEMLGGELIITCFAEIRDDVNAQCLTLKRLSAVGEVGLVLFYVGIVMKKVDKRLIKLADELAFPIILMPEDKGKLRYSEVIGDVMFALFQNQMSETQFKDDILERISRLPFYQRSIENVLRLLSDRVKASLLVTDASDDLLNMACYPRSLDLDAADILNEKKYSAQRTVRTTIGSRLNVYVVKLDGAISADDTAQIADVLRMSVNMWNQSHTEMVLPELVKAILQDEPIKMRRIAAAFNIDIESIHSMFLITPIDGDIATFDKAISVFKAEVKPICNTIITDIYNQDIVAFIDTPRNSDLPSVAEALSETLEREGIPAIITLCLNLSDSSQVRRVYLTSSNSLATARLIYPFRKVFTHHDMTFADECRAILEQGEQIVRVNTSLLDCLKTDDPAFTADLLETLTVYLLDSDSNMRDCAERLFIHLNSVKYRIRRAGELFSFKVGHLPETLEVYRAVALIRLLVVQKDNQTPSKIN
jgi:DNA-binding PucR family transcriptional regulator